MPLPDVPFVSVATGNIEPDTPIGAYKEFEGSDTAAVWGDYAIINRVHQSRHVYMMGLTSANGFPINGIQQTVAFAQLCNPTILWIMKWTTKRSKVQPKIPNPITADPNWVLLDRIPETRDVNVHLNGTTSIYRISGIYVYGHRRPSDDVINNIVFPIPAWMDATGFDRVLTAQIYEFGLGDTGNRVLRA